MFPDITTVELNVWLNKLTPQTAPKWGKMTAQHMVEHLADSLKYSNGTIVLAKPNVPERTFDTMRRFLLSDKPFPHGFISPMVGEDLPPLRFEKFSDAVDELLTQRLIFNDYYWKHPDAVFFNPLFGNLNRKEWLQFHSKHFFHHFSQFGLF